MAAGKFGRVLRSSLTSLLTPAEDPRDTFADPIQRQRALREQVRAAIAGAQAARTRLEDQRAAAEATLPELEQYARAALSSRREDLARNALRRRQVTVAAIAQISQHIALLDGELQRLAMVDQQIGTQLDAIAAREQLAAARRSTAQAQIEVGEALSGVRDEPAGAMEELERDAETLEARAAAIDELLAAGVLGNSARDFETDQEIERQLATLRQELGI